MNIHTLHVEHVVLLAVYSLLTLGNSWLHRGMKGIHWFSAYTVFAFFGAFAVSLRGDIPDFLSIVVGDVLVTGAYLVLFLALATLAGQKTKQVYLQAALVLFGAGAMVQFGWLHPDTPKRLLFYSAVLGLQQAHIAGFLCRKQMGRFRRLGGLMAVILTGLAVTNLIRMVGVMLTGAPRDYLQAGDFLASIVLANTCLQCGVMVAYVWMTSSLLRRDLQVQASTDPLTGLLNRRAVELAAAMGIVSCKKKGMPLCGVTIDLDHFKEINDTHGHICGDATLIAVAGCLQHGMRESDLLARTGGDEFTVLLPGTPLAAAMDIAERLRLAVASLEIVHGDVEIQVTASFGVAEVTDATAWQDLVTHCDHALYVVKRAGGNQAASGGETHAAAAAAGRRLKAS